MLCFPAPLLPEVALLGPTSTSQSGSGLVGYTSSLNGVQNPSAALETTLGVQLRGQGVESKHLQLSGSLLSLLLLIGVPAQEKVPAKLIVYLQRFRPQYYQRLLEVHSSREKPQGTKDADSSLG